ncbi:flavohemoprotein [Streptomyces sp. SCA3-4]|uniref:globin domain-containing protein n=1 Tax=Streptomyces sichuanensis TaxID=2871810 RepID=UPI001CE33B3A|nr:globin domain-containing protein [Streptomyces sichuanensis]MCA6095968.1 flavohemoprotein [Streptomyces sichuanensis]
MNTPRGNDYYALLARHDAMRLRRQLLAPGPSPSSGAAAGRSPADCPGTDETDRQLILDRLHLVTPFDELITHLYDVMFRRWPYLRSLFPESMAFQQEHLARMFQYLTDHLDRPDEVTGTFTRLGRDHRKLGVRPVHYEAFEASLREALRRQAGGQWTVELERAWLRMLRSAVAAMVAGADAALTEPPYWHAVVVGHELRRPDLAVLRVRTHEPYPYRPGQYGALESPLLPHAWRQYSLACAPRPDNVLEFHVRRTGTGGVSEALVSRTGVGDALRLGPAAGTMTLDDEGDHDLLLVAGGTGLAPVKALLEELAVRRTGRRTVHLFLGARHGADLYDAEWLTTMERRRPWLRVVPVLDEGSGPGAGNGTVADALARHGDWTGHRAYVSGPPGMVRVTVRRLRELGVSAAHIHHDPVPDAGERSG